MTTIPAYEKTWTHEGRPALHRRGIQPAPGPWMDEPDKVHWIDPATDLDCLAVRNGMGAWCGYVGLPPSHPFHGVGYGQCTRKDCGEEWCYDHSPGGVIDVHGGLTFADSCHESDEGEGHGICHVPLAGRPHDVWWLGFDCAHAGDLTPYDAAQQAAEPFRYWYRDGDVYRDLTYIKNECTRLAAQLVAVTA